MAKTFSKVLSALKSVFLVVVFSAVIFLLLFTFRKYLPGSEVLKPDSTWIETVGTVTKIGYGRGGVGFMDYEVNGKHYRGRKSRNDGSVLGEKYVLVVNPKQPEQYVVKYWNHIFVEGEATEFTTGSITEKHRTYSTLDSSDRYRTEYIAEFSYQVAGQYYKRRQALPPQSWDLWEKMKKGDCYEVEYLTANPQRASLHYDKPCQFE